MVKFSAFVLPELAEDALASSCAVVGMHVLVLIGYWPCYEDRLRNVMETVYEVIVLLTGYLVLILTHTNVS